MSVQHLPGTGRFKAWFGHDLALRWRNAFGVSGTSLIAGILNLENRSPSINSDDPLDRDETLDSIRGRTLFVTLKRTW